MLRGFELASSSLCLLKIKNNNKISLIKLKKNKTSANQ
jgi:hypothetical protein